MQPIKTTMLNLQFWVTITDLTTGALCTPYLILPAMGGFPLGLLTKWGVSTAFQVYLNFALVSKDPYQQLIIPTDGVSRRFNHLLFRITLQLIPNQQFMEEAWPIPISLLQLLIRYHLPNPSIHLVHP